MLRVSLLGTLTIVWNNELLPAFSTQKAGSLFGFLCLNANQTYSREFLAEMFWPERPIENARRSLHTALWQIRNLFKKASIPVDHYLVTSVSTVTWRSIQNFWLDVTEFETAYQSSDPQVLRAGVQVYRGGLLETSYDDWCLKERYRLELHYLQALYRLITYAYQNADFEEAVSLAEAYFKTDPFNEEIHGLLMTALQRQGKMTALVEHYKLYCNRLIHEGHPEPGEDLRHLFNELISGWQLYSDITPRKNPALNTSRPAATLSRVDYGGDEQTVFAGRKSELQQLNLWWEQRPEPVLSITGEQGGGKTRLAQEFSRRLYARGTLVGWARCYSYDQELPYPAVSDILHSLLMHVPPSLRSKIPSALCRELLLLAPDLEDVLPPQSRDPQPLLDTSHIYNIVANLLGFLARSFSILIVLDDFQRVSPATQQIMEYLVHNLDQNRSGDAQQVKVLLVCSLEKSQGAHASVRVMISRLMRDRLAMDLTVTNLDRDDTHHWLFLWAGDPQKTHALAEQLYLHTGGNPYFIMETIQTLIYSGSLRTSSQGWTGPILDEGSPGLPIPSSVSNQISERLRGLSLLALQVIQTAAVIGPVIAMDLLQEVLKRDDDDLLRAIEELISVGLLAEFISDETTGDVFRFPCLLYKQVIYHQTTQVRKTILEKRILRIVQEGRNVPGLL